MSSFLKDGLRTISRTGKCALREATSESSLRSLRQGVSASRKQAGDSARAVAYSPVTRRAASTARFVVMSGPVKEVAKICGRAGVAGAVVDGSMGTMQGLKAMRDGRIDGKQVLIHTGAEAGCGFVTSSSGTAGTIVAYMLTGTMGPAALVAGMGASLGTRYVYRQIIGETLPAEAAATSVVQKEEKDDSGDNEDSDGQSSLEEIGPKK